MKHKKCYISGKISGLEKWQYIDNFFDANQQLLKTKQFYSNQIISPLNLKPFLGIKCWLCYMITDIAVLRKCTHIAMQKNWTDSRGAVVEYFAAKFIFKLKIIWL